MGTSSLYKGPKKTSLLPADYNPEANLEFAVPEESRSANSIYTETLPKETEEQQDKSENKNLNGDEENPPSITWSTVRRSMRKAMNDRSSTNVKGVIRNYVKALGGHSNATRHTTKLRRTAENIYTYFTGTPSGIRQHLVDAGIHLDGRTTKDIFNDICELIAPVPNDIEDSLTNKALRETFSDIVADPNIDLAQFENFNEELLQRLVGGLIKHYIFDKLILQSEQTALKNCGDISNLRGLEKSIKIYIDGIVDSIIPNIIKNGLNATAFNKALETLCDISYQQMEDLV